jgi:PAS domain S-box-containing protein
MSQQPVTPNHPTPILSTRLEEILITGELSSRPHRLPKLDKENEALHTLARVMADSPRHLVDTLLQKALELCHADTAGLSVLEKNEKGEEVFHWTHLAGTLKDYVGGSTPRNHSPCGVTLDRNSPQLFRDAGRYFHYFNDVAVPITEGLVIPLVGNHPTGTIWIVTHNQHTHFDMEDVRIMSSLAAFTSSALRMIHLLDAEHLARIKAEKEIARQQQTEERERQMTADAVATNAKFRAVFDQTSVFAGILDLNGIVMDANRLCLEACGYHAEEVLGRVFWKTGWWRASPEVQDKIRMATVQATQGIPYREVLPYSLADGTQRFVEFALHPILDPNGRVIFLHPTGVDITDLKEAEFQQRLSFEKFRTMADAMPQMVWTARPDGFIDYYNQRWFDYTGLTLEESQGWGWKQTQHPEDVQSSIDKWELSLAAGEAFENEMRFLRRSDHSWRWHFTRAIPVRDEHGKITQWIGTCTDIDDRKAVEEALRNAQGQLETRVVERTAELRQEITDRRKAENELRELTGRLMTLRDDERRRIGRDLHDSVGQLLAVMSMNQFKALAEKQLSPVAASAISDNSTILAQVAKEIRTVAHLLHPPLLDEAGLPSALRGYLEGFSERGDVKIELVVPDDFGRLPTELETALFRVVQECLTNIYRHSGSSTAKVELSRLVDEVRLEVADQGKGIPAQRLSGVGLRGMRERVGQFGGQLEIQSIASGTTVIVRLPLPAGFSE